MKAVVYQEPYRVTVEQMPDPTIEAPNDAIGWLTTTNIRGSDLRMFEGRTPAEPDRLARTPARRGPRRLRQVRLAQ